MNIALFYFGKTVDGPGLLWDNPQYRKQLDDRYFELKSLLDGAVK